MLAIYKFGVAFATSLKHKLTFYQSITRFKLFKRKEIGAKAVRKMLVKLIFR